MLLGVHEIANRRITDVLSTRILRQYFNISKKYTLSRTSVLVTIKV